MNNGNRTAYSIGFTKHSAEEFFEKLKDAGIERLVDVRLNNVSQLAGFAKRRDLAYFLNAICGIEYRHEPLLAPTSELLSAYQKKRIDWATYRHWFRKIMVERRIEQRVDSHLFDRPSVLLCSELTPERCHRRLALDYLWRKWGDFEIRHL